MRDSPDVKCVFPKHLRELRGNGSADPLWSFSCADLLLFWRRARDQLKVTGYVPHQLRHRGPSHDRAQQLRSLESIQKRGRWKQLRSVTRYESAGRVAQEAMKLSLLMRKYAARSSRN